MVSEIVGVVLLCKVLQVLILVVVEDGLRGGANTNIY